MKKLFMVLAVASMFIASTAMASTWTASFTDLTSTTIPGHVGATYDSSGDLASPIAQNTWTFTMNDSTGAMDWPAGVVAMVGPVLAPSTDLSSDMILYVGSTWDGTNYESDLGAAGDDIEHGKFTADLGGGTVYNCALFGVVYDPPGSDSDWTDGTLKGYLAIGQDYDTMSFGNVMAGFYEWEATINDDPPPEVPIPGAAWLLLSGLVGIIGLRRRS